MNVKKAEFATIPRRKLTCVMHALSQKQLFQMLFHVGQIVKDLT
jgi:hypothetical protein